jgi:ApaG protein
MEEKNCEIRIHVATSYVDDQSEPDEDRYVFAYTITIANDGSLRTQTARFRKSVATASLANNRT